MATHRWREMLPEIVRYHPRRVAVPGTRGHWEQAISGVAGEEEITLLTIDEVCECGEDGCPSCVPLLTAEWAERADAVIALNRQALQHFRDGVAANGFQATIEPPKFDANMQSLQGLRPLIRLAKIQAIRFAQQGNPIAAARTLAEIIDAGRLVIDSDGMVIDYLVGIAFVGLGTYAADELLDRHRLPPEARELLTASIERLDFRSALANTLRSELNRWTLPTVGHFETRLRDQGLPAFFETFSTDTTGQHFWRDERLQDLLADHRQLFDADELVRGLACYTAEDLAECTGATIDEGVRGFQVTFKERLQRFDAVWPSEFVHPLFDVSTEADSEEDREIQALLRQQNESLKPIPADRLPKVRAALGDMINPLGMAVFGQLASLRAGALINLPLMEQQESLRRRLRYLRHPTLMSRLRELRRRWQAKRAERKRFRKRRA